MTIELVSRSKWTSRQVNPPAFSWGPINEIAVHHSAGTRPAAAADIPDILRAIERFHVETKGWTAAAYNFVPCPFVPGRVYEVRGLKGKSGATYGHNDHTVSVCFLGNFQRDRLTQIEIDNFRRLRHWLHEKAGKYPFVVRGHGDYSGNSTACPGGNIAADLVRLSTDWTAVPANPDTGTGGQTAVDRDELDAIRTLARSIVNRASALLGD